MPGVGAIKGSHVGPNIELKEVILDMDPCSIEDAVNDGGKGHNGQAAIGSEGLQGKRLPLVTPV